MSVTDLTAYREQQSPHVSGQARCLGCGHEWVDVVPVGTVTGLECGECHTHRGVLTGLCQPEDDARVFVCTGCDCDVFRLTPKGGMCLLCGTTTSYASIAEAESDD